MAKDRVPVLRRLALIFPLFLAACAPTSVPWQNPELPAEQWPRDLSACRRAAEAEVGYVAGDESSPFKDYDRAKAKRRTDALVEFCMRDRGYVPAPRRAGR